MKTALLSTLGAVVLFAASAPVNADKTAFNDAKAAVDYRQSALSIMKENFAAMAAMVKGEVDYDATIFQQRADDFSRLSYIPWSGFTVEGAMPGENTDALPEIWDNWDDFSQRAEDLQSDAEKLASAAASGDLEQIKPVFMQAAKNCKGCHDNYKD